MANSADRLQIQTEFDRVDRQTSLVPESIRPSATPVDQFIPSQAGDQLEQLSRALAPLSQEVAQYSDVLSRKNEEYDKAQAEANVSNAVRNGAKTYADAVKSGAIPASASPFYRLYAQRQFGQLAAAQMHSDFEAASATALAGATSLSQFDDFAQQFQKAWLEQHAGGSTNDIAFSQGFDPHANAAMAAEREDFASRIGKQLQVNTISALTQNQTQIILDGKRAGLTDDAISQKLNEATQAAFASGVSGDTLTQVNSFAVTNAAEQLLDHSVLDLAGKVKSGTGALEGTLQWGQARDKALPFILENNARINTVAQQKQKEAREKEVNDTLYDAFAAFSSSPDPEKVDVRPYVDRLRAAGASITDEERLLGLQKTVGTRQFAGDEPTFNNAYAEAIDPSGPKITVGDIHGLLLNGRLSQEQASKVLSALQERQKADESSGSAAIPKEPYYKLGMSALRTTFSYIDPSGVNKVSESNAVVEFDRRYRELHDSPAWSGGDKAAMVEKIRNDIMTSPIMPQAIRDAYAQSQKPGYSSADSSSHAPSGSYMADLARRAFREQQNGALSSETERALQAAGVTDLRTLYIQYHLMLPPPAAK